VNLTALKHCTVIIILMTHKLFLHQSGKCGQWPYCALTDLLETSNNYCKNVVLHKKHATFHDVALTFSHCPSFVHHSHHGKRQMAAFQAINELLLVGLQLHFYCNTIWHTAVSRVLTVLPKPNFLTFPVNHQHSLTYTAIHFSNESVQHATPSNIMH